MLLVHLHVPPSGQPLAPVGARRMLARAGKRAGLGPVKPHAFRHSFTSAVLGLEEALAGLGLLQDALALDMRKPQDYFHRVWSTAFRAPDLAAAGDDGHADREQE